MPKDFVKIDINEILQLKSEELADDDTTSGFTSRILEIERTQNHSEAGKLINFLENILNTNKDFERDHHNYYKEYRDLVLWLKFISLHLLLDDDIYRLVKDNLLTGIDLEIDVRSEIKQLFKASWDPFLRGEKRDLLLKAFSQNEQLLGDFKLIFSEDRQKPATVANLILAYNQFAKSEDVRGGLEEANFLDNSPSASSLTGGNRERALKILQLYDFVRFPPLEEMAREMVNSPFSATTATVPGKRGLPLQPLAVPGGDSRIEPISSTLDPLDMLKQKYQSYRIQRQKVLQLEDAIIVKSKGDPEGIKKELAAASRSRDKERLIASIKVLARQGALISSWQNSQAWQQAVSDYILKKYSNKNNKQDVATAISNMKINLGSPEVMAEFLQYLLKEKLGMTENDSALVGSEIGQILKGDYQSMAYGNEESGSFEWKKNKIEDQQLVG